MTSDPDRQLPQGDPRPLIGEPLSLDLLTTRWRDAEGPRDLLESTEGLRIWLGSAGLADRTAADRPTLDALLDVRDALLELVRHGNSPEASAALDRTLSHGHIRRSLGPEGVRETLETDDPAYLAAWLAADDCLRLLQSAPTRIRRCAHPECVLHFHDISKNGTRRW
ncbi:CGNR zinc finger domain-containing protein [Streptomyces cavernae]|uniref:CGNR zinc finger domain-containing protein n=1 Tax=Streptomyces cavernae TaxID=2259034 RepID=UPI00192E6E05|nr:CGNR zinc finger domain-containing protein [Streptomyces cavernae]